MFSGIIEDMGQVQEVVEKGEGRVFAIATRLKLSEIKLGDSIAVDGCCLTVTKKKKNFFEIFASHETLARTTLGNFKKTTKVNLERALSMATRLDGHLVQGHVEGKGKIIQKEKVGDSLEISIEMPLTLRELVIPKGSIAVDGVSLTINSIKDEKKRVIIGINLIPHTLEKTTLNSKKTGEEVNLETDMLGRYVKRYLDLQRS